MFTDDGDIDVLARPTTGRPSKFIISPDAAVLPTMASMGNCELAVKDDGQAMVIFTTKLPEDIHWIEYDVDLSMLTFVTWSGKVMGLGMKVHKPFRKYLKMTKEVIMVGLDQDRDIISTMYPAKLVVRHIGI